MEDAKIIALFWNRDEDAICQTDATYGRKLHSLSNRILDDCRDAEESVNDTYLKTWESIPPYRPKHLFAFLASICRHLSLNKLDWNLAEKRNAQIVSLTQEMECCIPDRMVEAKMAGKEIGKLLNQFLDSLPQESRVIFLRRYWFVDTVAEIAARYGMTESKVKMQLSRTRSKLAAFLEKEGITV